MQYDLIIIGAGPAGITAGIYAGRQRMKTLVLTKEFGGQIAQKAVEICNYPGFENISGPKLIENFVSHLKCQETVDIKFGEAEKIEKQDGIFILTDTRNQKLKAKAVIIATGADPRPLEAEGEKEFIGKGVSYCVTCDGPVFKGKPIAVVGGGNAGLEAAFFMQEYATKIYILESGLELKADRFNVGLIQNSEKIEIIFNASVKKIKGGALVDSLEYEDKKTGKTKTLKVQGIFIEIGSQPATSLAKGLVDFTKRDEIIVDPETFQTKTPGLFAAGDNNMGHYKQIVTATGEGCKAALAAYEYIQKTKKTGNNG